MTISLNLLVAGEFVWHVHKDTDEVFFGQSPSNVGYLETGLPFCNAIACWCQEQSHSTVDTSLLIDYLCRCGAQYD